MTQTFEQFLDKTRPDMETMQLALRYYIAEAAAYKSEEEMITELEQQAVDRRDLDVILAELTAHPARLDAAATAALREFWEIDPHQVRQSIVDGRGKLPVIDLGILGTVTVYAMYLLTTRGVKRREDVIRRDADGSFEVKSVTEYSDVSSFLSRLVSLFDPRRGY